MKRVSGHRPRKRITCRENNGSLFINQPVTLQQIHLPLEHEAVMWGYHNSLHVARYDLACVSPSLQDSGLRFWWPHGNDIAAFVHSPAPSSYLHHSHYLCQIPHQQGHSIAATILVGLVCMDDPLRTLIHWDRSVFPRVPMVCAIEFAGYSTTPNAQLVNTHYY